MLKSTIKDCHRWDFLLTAKHWPRDKDIKTLRPKDIKETGKKSLNCVIWIYEYNYLDGKETNGVQ